MECEHCQSKTQDFSNMSLHPNSGFFDAFPSCHPQIFIKSSKVSVQCEVDLGSSFVQALTPCAPFKMKFLPVSKCATLCGSPYILSFCPLTLAQLASFDLIIDYAFPRGIPLISLVSVQMCFLCVTQDSVHILITFHYNCFFRCQSPLLWYAILKSRDYHMQNSSHRRNAYLLTNKYCN